VNPLIGAEEIIHSDEVLCGRIASRTLRRQKEYEVGLHKGIEQNHGLPSGAKLENPRIHQETVPLSPNLDRGFGQVRENVGRQFHIIPVAVEFQDAILRGDSERAE
jgi:hypothetical protein